MKFQRGIKDLVNKKLGQEQCYLITNGLGGYSALSSIGSMTRNDHALLMAAIKAPTIRYHIVSNVQESIVIDGCHHDLSSQQFVCHSSNLNGEKYLVNFKYDGVARWTYFIDGIEIIKTIAIEDGKNTVGVKYQIINQAHKKVKFYITPCVQFVARSEILKKEQKFEVHENKITSKGIILNIKTQHDLFEKLDQFVDDLYFQDDARDGRCSYGAYRKTSRYGYHVHELENIEIIFTLEKEYENVDAMIHRQFNKIEKLIQQSKASSSLSKSLVQASDAFIVSRESTKSKTIIAGYPFFIDWGRDTMIALEGLCIKTKRFDETKDILMTFVKYIKNGLMPNLFPEGDNEPEYNSVDASLLFIQSVFAYYKESHDIEFIKKVYPAIVEIINAYIKGTDFDIYMDEDGLIHAGSGLMQLTWMDIRYEDILPTPRHGKAVEINAYWYSSLCILVEFSKLLNLNYEQYLDLILKVKKSFLFTFWNEKKQCLYDWVNKEEKNDQIRCNQIYAVSVFFSPLEIEQSRKVVDCVFNLLYTPYGLRTLSVDDKEFVGEYSGSLKKRDLSYHQGTIWPFVLGSYYRAYLKVNQNSIHACMNVKRQLEYLETTLTEGCMGQISEIYDGLVPTYSRGCFGQAWSVGELLKISLELDSYE